MHNRLWQFSLLDDHANAIFDGVSHELFTLPISELLIFFHALSSSLNVPDLTLGMYSNVTRDTL